MMLIQSLSMDSGRHLARQAKWQSLRIGILDDVSLKRNSKVNFALTDLAERLYAIYGNNYSKRNLQYYRKFYLLFPSFEKVNELVHNLTWTHIRRLLSVTNDAAREWYLIHCSKDMWSTTTLDRNIASQYSSQRRRIAARN